MVENASRTSPICHSSSTASVGYIANVIYPDTACLFALCRYSVRCVRRRPRVCCTVCACKSNIVFCQERQ